MEKEEFAALLDEKFSEVFRRLDGVDQRFDGVDKRFDGVDKRFDGVDKRFDGVDKRFDGVDARANGIDARLNGLETEMRKLRINSEETKSMLQRNNELIHAVDEKVERFRKDTSQNFKQVKRIIGVSNAALKKRIVKLEKAS